MAFTVESRSADTGPVNLKVVPVTGAALAGHHGPIHMRLSFPTTTIIIGIKYFQHAHFILIMGMGKRGAATRSTIEGGRGCNKFSPVLRGNGTKIAPTGDIFDQHPGGMSWIRGKLADHVEDHVVLSPEEGVSVTSPGTDPSYPRPPQSGQW